MRFLLPGAVGIIAAGMAGCVQDDGSVFIDNALLIDPESNNCVVNAQTGTLLAAGLFDVLNPARGYQAALKVRTNLPATFTTSDVTQGETKAPNYPDYGATDNNIIIFKNASVDFSFVTNAETAAAVADNFTCDNANTCTRPGEDSLVSGSVFNVNTSLSTEAVVFLEAISAAEATLFKDTFADQLATTSARQRVIANIRVQGTTTGTGEISSFPFPFAIDLCKGCLAPDNDFCAGLPANAGVVGAARPADNDICFLGQDFPSSKCFCVQQNANGTTTDLGPALNDSCL
jgi:hypothetical protein